MAHAPSSTASVSDPAPQLWISFTGYTAPNFTPRNVVIQFMRASRREFSHVVTASTPCHFSSPIDCKLPLNAQNAFVLYALNPDATTLTEAATVLLRFSLDTTAIHKRLEAAVQQPICLSKTSPTGVQIKYEASTAPPLHLALDESSVLSSIQDDTPSIPTTLAKALTSSSSALDSSFSSVSEEEDAIDHSPSTHSKRKPKVRFTDKLHLIPTTQQLKSDLDNAAIERAQLSNSLTDLSVQVSRLQRELRHVKKSLNLANHSSPCTSFVQPVNHLSMSSSSCAKRQRVVLDAHSVACAYGNGQFRPQGIAVALQYYHNRDIHAVAIASKRAIDTALSSGKSSRDSALQQLIHTGLLAVTNSHSRRQDFIIRYSLDHNAYIVSNESMRYKPSSKQSSKRDQRFIQSFLDSHRIQFMFVANDFVPISPSIRQSKSTDCITTVSRTPVTRSDSF
ncbi:hypothetical protein BWQ96_06676 [Gracilariopsis chorda]|uniref:RNase NYN domain-containing protein n=1 Tax=Gracilariopsis chorda TaxID=448386 RepID=A0A2V3INA8_9FLOR|nr:hypothetical protein BWQ96_06676 [Gracilariopsis chorda]|eukprot:PXF43564.1 hypothetical protein BWQ96_06676 [Gracilariopsis chorda]